ncbi:hypothetical protein AADG42_07805 [Ammonicoccus fulvus]|uniref:WD40 repeat domain-containing protein n=1 Tax=Ammonicoccus fulvus TaxID=3138240 RepID=A0ABZ3FMC2_9ACTN
MFRSPRVVLVSLLVVATTAALSTVASPPHVPWRPVVLAGSGQVVTLTGTPEGMLVGRYAPDAATRVSLQRVDLETGESREVPLTMGPGYARETELVSVSVLGSDVVAVGGARGGAHGNVRWSVWRGSPAGLQEEPQTFETFGGWEAGGLVGSAYASAGPLIMGSWASPSGGVDFAVWQPVGERWLRIADAGPDLRATATRQPAAFAVTSDADSYFAVGSVTELGAPPVERPALWHSTSPRGPWRLTELPVPSAATGQARAVAVSCAASRCVVAGRAGPQLLSWRLTLAGDGPAHADPPVIVAQDVIENLRLFVARGSRSDWIALADGNHTQLTEARGTRQRIAVPGVPTAMATDAEGHPVVATTTADGTTRLWHPEG